MGGPIIRDGNLYGVTVFGGPVREGVAFEVTTKGRVHGDPYTFSGPDGSRRTAG